MLETITNLLQPLAPELVAGAVAIIGALCWLVAIEIRLRGEHATLRGEYAKLKLKVDQINVDDTERERRISSTWQALIQTTFSQQADELRHLRDLLAAQESKASSATVLAQNVSDAKDLQIAGLQTQVDELKTASMERDELKREVAALTDKVRELEQKSDLRISEITERNAKAYLDLQNMTAERDALQAKLDACEAHFKALSTPTLKPGAADV